MKKLFNVGDKIVAFDSSEWMKTGDDVDNNDIFFKPAKVINIKQIINTLEWLADIEFEDGRKSRGHFQRTLIQNNK